MRLPDFEAWAIFAKVAETRSFGRAAADLGLSTATVSKAVSRLEARLGVSLLHRTTRRLSLTQAGAAAVANAAQILAAGETADQEATMQSAAPRGGVRLATPMSFGLQHVAPILPEFLAAHPGVSVDLHLSDEQVDVVGQGFDLVLRIATLSDSTLRVRRLCQVGRTLVGAPAYLDRAGRPRHPRELSAHACLGYAYLPSPDRWRFTDRDGATVDVTPKGPLRANNADALAPAVLAGLGLAVQPDFTVWGDVAAGRLETVLEGWSLPPIALNIVLPPGKLRPTRVSALVDFLAARLVHAPWATSEA